jgi:hypothetical protein
MVRIPSGAKAHPRAKGFYGAAGSRALSKQKLEIGHLRNGIAGSDLGRQNRGSSSRRPVEALAFPESVAVLVTCDTGRGLELR